ncbi:MAG TPA: hydroxymethylbilane synthase [Vicinamibacterales bacterium]|nr:hydroxymethylbilane synthase [Vicinamibacterales bacterium]
MTVGRPLKIGTRGSQLALWQSRAVATLLERTGTPVELVVIKTSGDRLQEAPLSEVGGKRLFVKEIEDALLQRAVDLAVHSAKDMPAVLPEGLEIAATLPREDPRDALVLPSRGERALEEVLRALGSGRDGRAATVGTSSVRRAAQLASVIPGAVFGPIRGNVDTRLRKLDAGDYDALVLAAAGMKRLGFAERISTFVPASDCVPAPGQGIIAIEIREGDDEVRHALEGVHDETAGVALMAERAVVAALGGGCQLPLGAIAIPSDGRLEMHGVVASVDGARVIKRHVTGAVTDPTAVGRQLAEELARGGATAILDDVRGAQGPVEGSY